jgi:uncharacterized OB-fold protein
MKSEWPLMSGRGTIYSFVIAHPPVLPAFADRTPLPIVLVELEEDPGLRIIGNLAPGGGELRIGAKVEVDFEDVTPEVTLPVWRIRTGS